MFTWFDGDLSEISGQMYDFLKVLYPLCRSITGEGVRQTLNFIQQHIPLQLKSLPTGMEVFDWVIPKEWNIKDAYIKNSKGERVVDFQQSNLHVLNYSIPIKKKISLDELQPHLFTLPDNPTAIPYLTSYYKDNWGFCLTHEKYLQLKDDNYEVMIDSSLCDGELNWGEYVVQGESAEEILISCYICHPSLCNDNLSGVVLSAFLAKYLQNKKLKYSYRFLFIPETIGAIAWLSLNEVLLSKIKHGFVVTCVGDPGNMTYKKTRNGDEEIDRAVIKVLQDTGKPFSILEFDPCGSDERQYCSPGINLSIGSLMRTPYGCYPEYHTSLDNLDFVKAEYLEESFDRYLQVFNIFECDGYYLNTNPKGEPKLGKRGLYRTIGSSKTICLNEQAILWILNFSDEKHSLLDISIKSKIKFTDIVQTAHELLRCGLLRPLISKLPNQLRANCDNQRFYDQ